MKEHVPVMIFMIALGVGCVGLAGGRSAASAATRWEQDEFYWEGRIAPGGVVEVLGVNGSIQAGAASGAVVEVRGTKHGPQSELDQVRIEVTEYQDGVTVRAVHPRRKSGRVRVDFTVQVPRGVHLKTHTVNGKIEATSLQSDVEAHTVNGGIEISTTGYAEAQSVNGSIDVSMESANWNDPLRFETVNGSITVELPAGAGVEFRAETVNGSIWTDFPVTVQGRFKKNRLRGTIGDGGRMLTLKTVNGGIRLLRGPN